MPPRRSRPVRFNEGGYRRSGSRRWTQPKIVRPVTVRIANAMRPEYIKTEPTRSASTKADIAAAKRHLDEIQTSFDQLYGKEGRSADEQRKALARQQRKTSHVWLDC